jgi:hypothetical protein
MQPLPVERIEELRSKDRSHMRFQGPNLQRTVFWQPRLIKDSKRGMELTENAS